MSLYRAILALSILAAVALGTTGVALTYASPGLSGTVTKAGLGLGTTTYRLPSLSTTMTEKDCSDALNGTAWSRDDDIQKVETAYGNGTYLASLFFVRRQGKFRIVMSGTFWIPNKITAKPGERGTYKSIPLYCIKRTSRIIKDQARTPPAGF